MPKAYKMFKVKKSEKGKLFPLFVLQKMTFRRFCSIPDGENSLIAEKYYVQRWKITWITTKKNRFSRKIRAFSKISFFKTKIAAVHAALKFHWMSRPAGSTWRECGLSSFNSAKLMCKNKRKRSALPFCN